MSDPTRGITCPDMRRVVREAISGGWVFDGWTGTTHAAIRWPKTGARLTFGSTPSVASWKTLATDIEKASGVKVWRKGNRKRSRKADALTGFSIDAARRESRTFHSAWGSSIQSLTEERDELVAAIYEAAADGRRDHLRGIAPRLARVAEIERVLADDFHQPVERFDPHDLARFA